MNFKEFQEFDTANIYFDYLSVEEAKKDGTIPEDFADIFPDKCRCGSDNMISQNKKTMMCVDPACPIKIAKSMSYMFSKFDQKNLGDETCKTITNYCLRKGIFKIPSHMEILNIPYDCGLEPILGARWADLWQSLECIRNSEMTFGQLVSKMGIPYFDNKAEKALEDLDSVRDLVNLAQNNSIKQFLSLKGIYDEKVAFSLFNNLRGLIVAEYSLKKGLLKPGEETKVIALTGPAYIQGIHFSRAKFIEFCNKLGNVNGRQLFTVIGGKAVQSCDYVIAEYPSSSNTYNAALTRERMTGEKIIVTGDEYINILREEVSRWLEKNTETKTS